MKKTIAIAAIILIIVGGVGTLTYWGATYEPTGEEIYDIIKESDEYQQALAGRNRIPSPKATEEEYVMKAAELEDALRTGNMYIIHTTLKQDTLHETCTDTRTEAELRELIADNLELKYDMSQEAKANNDEQTLANMRHDDKLFQDYGHYISRACESYNAK